MKRYKYGPKNSLICKLLNFVKLLRLFCDNCKIAKKALSHLKTIKIKFYLSVLWFWSQGALILVMTRNGTSFRIGAGDVLITSR